MDVERSREGFNRLLAHYPYATVARVENQDREVIAVIDRGVPIRYLERAAGPWTCVDLIVPTRYSERLERFAIWNHTGNVYRVDPSGAVEDDPFITVDPLFYVEGVRP